MVSDSTARPDGSITVAVHWLTFSCSSPPMDRLSVARTVTTA
jgi:hypothetical protein